MLLISESTVQERTSTAGSVFNTDISDHTDSGEPQLGEPEEGDTPQVIIIDDADPLQNIRNIRKITTVIKDGNIYNPVQLHQMVGFSK